ncbi:MAG: tetratricopeptide repeat protein, partial [bacterium]|nr:tetratricopeptide repeat protein [bacterium]
MPTTRHDSPPTQPWWPIPLVTALAAVGLYALLRWNPVSWITQLYTVFIITFGLVWLLTPARFFRRMSGAALTAAGAAAAIPTINAQISLPGWLAASFVVEGAGWLAPVLAAVSLGFGLLELRRQQPSPASTSAGGDIVAVGDGGSYTKVVGAVDPDTLAKIVDRYDQDVKERDTSLAESKERIRDLEAALARVNTEADKGDPQAKAAIEEARKSGDATKLQAALIAQADRRQQQIRDDAADYLELCREIAAIAFLRGDLDEARKRLEAINRLIPNDLDAINRLGHIHRVQGRLDEAERSYRRVLDLSADDETGRAVAYGNLGLIYLTRGDLDQAEEMHGKALDIEEKLGRLEGMANQYGNLGLIHQTRGDLDQAEEMHRKALEIFEKLGQLEGMAAQYGNLGLIHRMRGDLDQAEEMHRKSLEIKKKLGRLEGMASDYAAIGLVHSARGDL